MVNAVEIKDSEVRDRMIARDKRFHHRSIALLSEFTDCLDILVFRSINTMKSSFHWRES
jgi:hypothetical protein